MEKMKFSGEKIATSNININLKGKSMSDRLEKVRAEVERLRQKVMGVRTDFADGQKGVLTELLSFIDSMQKEPKFKIGQTITDPDDSTFTFHINKIENGKYIESDDAWVLIKDADEEYQLVEEPVSEELEEAALMHFKDVMEFEVKTGLKMANITSFKAGANWQKEKTIRKACDWITEINNHHYIMRYSDSCEVTSKELIEWFKNYMRRIDYETKGISS